MTEAYILDAARTPRGKGKPGKGALSGIHPQELLAQTLNRLAQRAGIDTRDVDDVVMGCVTQAGSRVPTSPATPCSPPSGPSKSPASRSTASAAPACRPSTSPRWASSPARSSSSSAAASRACPAPRWAPTAPASTATTSSSRQKHFQVPQGISADLIATLEGFTREQVDAFALDSQRKAAAAQQANRFERSLFPVTDPATGAQALAVDEYPRASTTAEGLAALEPAFLALGATPFGLNGETMDQNRPRPLPAGRRDQPRPHRRQLQRHRRRRRRRAAGLRRLRQCPRAQAPRPHPRDGDRRRRADHHAHRADPRLARRRWPRLA